MSPTLKPWAHLGAGTAKASAPKKGQLGRKVSEVRPSFNEVNESSVSEERSQTMSNGKPRKSATKGKDAKTPKPPAKGKLTAQFWPSDNLMQLNPLSAR